MTHVLEVITAVVLFAIALVLLFAIIVAPSLPEKPRTPFSVEEVGALVVAYLLGIIVFCYAGARLLAG